MEGIHTISHILHIDLLKSEKRWTAEIQVTKGFG